MSWAGRPMITLPPSQPMTRVAKPCAKYNALTAGRSPRPFRTSAASMGLRRPDLNTARTFFEQNFQPVRIARLGETQGFLTGYYEPIVQGSRFPNPEFHVPLYRRPPALVV